VASKTKKVGRQFFANASVLILRKPPILNVRRDWWIALTQSAGFVAGHTLTISIYRNC
jgi:hypothetical protein